MAVIRFIGTGEAFDPSLPNTSVLYRGRLQLLIDCGYGVPHALWRTLRDPEALDGIYLSHHHADHCFGLPALIVWMRVAGRRRPLHLIGGPGTSQWVGALLELGYPGACARPKCYPLQLLEVAPGQIVQVEGVKLRTAPTSHSLPNHALRIDDSGCSFGYSGDGAPTPATRALFRDANVVVHECYSATSGVEGHSHAAEVLELAAEANIGRICLVHVEALPATRQHVRDVIDRHPLASRVLVPNPGDELDLGAECAEI